MKCITLFLCCAAALRPADFTTGQAARLVIGQTTFTAQDSNSSDIVVGGTVQRGTNSQEITESDRDVRARPEQRASYI